MRKLLILFIGISLILGVSACGSEEQANEFVREFQNSDMENIRVTYWIRTDENTKRKESFLLHKNSNKPFNLGVKNATSAATGVNSQIEWYPTHMNARIWKMNFIFEDRLAVQYPGKAKRVYYLNMEDSSFYDWVKGKALENEKKLNEEAKLQHIILRENKALKDFPILK